MTGTQNHSGIYPRTKKHNRNIASNTEGEGE